MIDELVDNILAEEATELSEGVQFNREIERFQEDLPQHQDQFDKVILWCITNSVSGKPASKILKRVRQEIKQAENKGK